MNIIELMKCHTQEQADTVLAALVENMLSDVQMVGLDQDTAELWVRRDIGYLAGRMNHEDRARMERLFKCAHPIFGAIDANAPPTPEQAFALGGLMALNPSSDYKPRMSFLVPRVDADRQARRDRVSGIYIRALGTDGQWESHDIEILTRDSLLGWMQQQPREVLERLALQLLDHKVPA